MQLEFRSKGACVFAEANYIVYRISNIYSDILL